MEQYLLKNFYFKLFLIFEIMDKKQNKLIQIKNTKNLFKEITPNFEII
jgi:hypothetical protein